MSKPVTMIDVKTPDGKFAKYFNMQERSLAEWLEEVARYETKKFPKGTRFISATVIARLANEQLADSFIASQKASYESVGILVLNSDAPVKGRPVLELVEA